MMLLTTDRLYKEYFVTEWALQIEPIVIPYKATSSIEELVIGSPLSLTTGLHRTLDFTFHGNLARHCAFDTSNEGCLRSVIELLAARLNSAGFPTVVDNQALTNGQPSQQQINHQIEVTTADINSSQFCFVPGGDTPTSRRIFDGLAAGTRASALANTPSESDATVVAATRRLHPDCNGFKRHLS